MPPERRYPQRQSEGSLANIMVTRDLLDQAVHSLAVGAQGLRERLERSSVPLATLRREDLASEEELSLFARVELGLSQLRRDTPAGEDLIVDELPIFALEATASHIVELRDATTARMFRAASARRKQPRH